MTVTQVEVEKYLPWLIGPTDTQSLAFLGSLFSRSHWTDKRYLGPIARCQGLGAILDNLTGFLILGYWSDWSWDVPYSSYPGIAINCFVRFQARASLGISTLLGLQYTYAQLRTKNDFPAYKTPM